MVVKAMRVGREQPRSQFLYDTHGTCHQMLTIPFVVYGGHSRKRIEDDIRFYCRSRGMQYRLDVRTGWWSRLARYLLVVEGNEPEVTALLEFVRNHPIFS